MLLMPPLIADSAIFFLFMPPLVADSTAFLLLIRPLIADSAAFLLLMPPLVADSTALLLLMPPTIAYSCVYAATGDRFLIHCYANLNIPRRPPLPPPVNALFAVWAPVSNT